MTESLCCRPETNTVNQLSFNKKAKCMDTKKDKELAQSFSLSHHFILSM